MHNQFKTQKFKHLMLAMGPRDLNSAPYSPVHCSSHSMTSFQSSELTEIPVVENSQLFAQRVHSARYAPCVDNVAAQWRAGVWRVRDDGVAEWDPSVPSSLPIPPFCRPAVGLRHTSPWLPAGESISGGRDMACRSPNFTTAVGPRLSGRSEMSTWRPCGAQ